MKNKRAGIPVSRAKGKRYRLISFYLSGEEGKKRRFRKCGGEGLAGYACLRRSVKTKSNKPGRGFQLRYWDLTTLGQGGGERRMNLKLGPPCPAAGKKLRNYRRKPEKPCSIRWEKPERRWWGLLVKNPFHTTTTTFVKYRQLRHHYLEKGRGFLFTVGKNRRRVLNHH